MLIKCPECGKDVSDKSEKCIHCGYPLNLNTTPLTTKTCPLCKNNSHIRNGIEDKCSVCGYVFNVEECKSKDPTWRIVKEQPNTPKCPICGSTNLSKITNTKKVTKILAFGVFGMGDNGKTWKCNNCGSKF